ASRPQEETIEQVQYVSNFNSRGYNNNSTPTHYHPSNRNHENFSYANNKNVLNPPGFTPQSQENKKSLEDLVGAFIAESSNRSNKLEEAVIAINTTVNGHSAAIKNIETQLGQLVSVVNTMNKGKAPAEQEKSSLEYCKAVSVHYEEETKLAEEEKTTEPEELTGGVEEGTTSNEAEKLNPESSIPSPTVLVPKSKKKKNSKVKFDKFLDAFMGLHVNIPFSDALEQMPHYRKFMKEWLNKKKKEKQMETVYLASTCSARVQQKVPEKLSDPGSFTIPCNFGTFSCRALCDLGASINIIPLSLCKKLNIGEIKSTSVRLQLADQSVVSPYGIVENILIKVGRFFLPVDFFVLDIKENPAMPIILGRPFLATGRVIIDIERRELIIRVQQEKEVLKAFEDPKNTSDTMMVGYRRGARKSTSDGKSDRRPP
ncbi:retropepsin-like domain-containing protein, partial [Salmonella enterica]|nr:retropepsin-like domain-containing protein [Salmonella enterica]